MTLQQGHCIGYEIGYEKPLTRQVLPRLRILVVEDNLTNQRITLKLLQTLGYKADLAVNGQEAVEGIADRHYDLVLMDCHMPILDGYSATRSIRDWERQMQASRKTVIVAMTASNSAADRDRAIAAGMDDYLSKPVRREALAALLNRFSRLIDALPHSGSLTVPAAAIANSVEAEALQFHLDLDHLNHVSDQSPEFALELLQIFVKDSRTHLVRLQAAIAAYDFAEMAQLAHHLKGASANVGAKALQFIAAQIEEQAYQRQMQNADRLATELGLLLQRVEKFVDDNTCNKSTVTGSPGNA